MPAWQQIGLLSAASSAGRVRRAVADSGFIRFAVPARAAAGAA